MDFNLNKSIEILERTPAVLEQLLSGLSDSWLHTNEGPDTWSPFDVLGHLIHGEKTDWIPRMEIILSSNLDKHFEPFDRFAQMNSQKQRSLAELLLEFRTLREENIKVLKSKKLQESDLQRTGIHPAFGEVTLKQLLATWTVHDLNHLTQISRVMAGQYHAAVGPWQAYLKILQ
ncbi:MAG: DinB family protein [Saprospiraceae bacterium]|nr:DinB family protein [Saprospiraceae bacterium]MCB9344393.1 DinB family protein [Lewinellaceae bacterium]